MAEYYVGEYGVPGKNDGSLVFPFHSLGDAFSSGKILGGDKINLLAGNYGDVSIKNVRFDTPVTIVSMAKYQAVFDRIFIQNCKNLHFFGVAIIWSLPPSKWNSLFYTDWQSSHITIEDSLIRAHPRSSSFRLWTAESWLERSATGISMNGTFHKARKNRIQGVGFGIQFNGSDCLAEYNWINGYSGDGLRGNGHRLVFFRNRVLNAVSVDGNHADGFQSFNLTKDGSMFDGITLDSNIIIECTFPERLPLSATLQGIGMFDGMFSNLTIINNYVEVSAYHGICVTGVAGLKLLHNTVVKAPGGDHSPWILVTKHKDGRPSSDVTIANNMSASRVFGDFGQGINNLLIGEDYIGKADPAYTTLKTITGRKRKTPADVGAY